MSIIKVTASELQSAGDAINKAAEAYRSAATALKSSADNLAGTWEGDSQVAFVQEQEKANAWYNKMAEIAEQYAAKMKEAADRYVETDDKAATLIKSR